jgi:hypothetical protein
MKNDTGRRADRIVELLAESLKKQDQMIERMDKSEKQQKEYNERVVVSVNALADIVGKWMVQTKKV